jgi:membrane protease YdiL (CAAX protease family)
VNSFAVKKSSETSRSRLQIEILLFFGISFAITWGVLGLYLWNAPQMTEAFGPMKLGAPMFYVAVSAPATAAIILTFYKDGWRGVVSFLVSLFRGRAYWPWILISLLGYPVLWFLVNFGTSIWFGRLDQFNFSPWVTNLPIILLSGHFLKDIGALGEEPGWRGYALPRLLALMNARIASVVLGLVWAVWHLPAFFLSSMSQSGIMLFPYVLTVIAFSVLMTLIYVHTNGNVLLSGIIPHMLFNAVPKAGIEPNLWVTVFIGAFVLLVYGPKMRRDDDLNQHGELKK